LYPDLELDQWLQDGSRHTPTLPELACYLSALIPRPERILDVGCGSGELLRLLMKSGFSAESLYGLDIEPDHAELARRRTGLDTIHCGVLDGTTPMLTAFDVITAINWLQSDWPNTYAVKAARQPPNSTRLVVFLDGCERYLTANGLLIWEWHTTPPDGFLALLESRGWQQIDRLDFYPANSSERYPTFIHRRPA